MSTAHSSTEPPRPRGLLAQVLAPAELRRALSDARAIFALRVAGLHGKSRRVAVIAAVFMAVVTLATAIVPSLMPEGEGITRFDVLLLLPSAIVGVFVLAVVASAVGGGGREMIPREESVAFPISPTTDHLGALAMAPLNIAWILQAWVLLGAVSYASPASWRLLPVQIVTVICLALATALAQVVSWGIEWVRRGPGGIWAVRIAATVLGVGLGLLVAAGELGELLDDNPVSLWPVVAMLDATNDRWLTWAWKVGVLLVLTLIAVVVGALMTALVARRAVRDEVRLETASRRPAPQPNTDFGAMLHLDRASVWRSMPLRRGLLVLGVMPGGVALAGGIDWDMLTIFPGLVASGGALLFGVNAWCLDGRGALWRDSLPVSPGVAFAARTAVLTEVLLVATAITIAMAMLRAGLPSFDEVVAVLCAVLVVVAMVVSRSLQWSVTRPFAMDLRSARATPAPPSVMVGYSARLTLTTTLAGMLFVITARAGAEWSVLLALPFLLLAARRLAWTSRQWADPVVRAGVNTTVVG